MGRFAGTGSVQQGVCSSAARAGGKFDATLVLSGGEAVFAPGDGVTLLRGRVTEAGHVVASLSRPGNDADRFLQVFEGDVKDGQVTGRYASPRCRADVTLMQRS